MAMKGAAAWILAMNSSGKVVYWAGVTTTPISDGSTTNPVMINGSSVTIRPGGAVGYNGNEFVLSEDGVWQEFGETDVQHKTLDTPIDVDGTEVTTVEGALSAINEYAEDIEESLGTASAKNAISVVTDSSDLVESGAVKDIVGWENKNLFPRLDKFTSLNGIDYTPLEDGSIIANGTATNWATVSLKTDMFLKAGTYTLSGSPSQNGTYVSIAIGNDTYNSIAGEDRTFTLDADTIVEARISVRNGATVTNAVFKPQLEVGSTATTYEPYHASVNQTLRNAEVIKGKNLIGWKIGYVYSSTDGSLSPNTHGACSEKIKVTAGQKFIGSKKNTLGSNDGMFARTYDANGDFVGTIIVLTNTQLRNEITIPANIGYIGVFQLRNSADVSREWLDSNEIMFYDASETDSTYEPYYVPLKDVVPTKADNSVIGTVEDGANPTKSYAVGEHFIRNGKFCICISAVTTSSDWTLNTNYIEEDISAIISRLLTTSPESQFSGNCDDLPTGFAYVNNSATNAPEAWSIILTYSTSIRSNTGTYLTQIAYPANGNDYFYKRIKANGVWKSWVKHLAIKSDTFSGTTSENGLVALTSDNSKIVLGVLLTASYAYELYQRGLNAGYGLRVLSATTGEPVASTSVSGTYYYI